MRVINMSVLTITFLLFLFNFEFGKFVNENEIEKEALKASCAWENKNFIKLDAKFKIFPLFSSHRFPKLFNYDGPIFFSLLLGPLGPQY
ncbi:hypothetical protein AAHE18_02G051700 [Arachis hypogaea]